MSNKVDLSLSLSLSLELPKLNNNVESLFVFASKLRCTTTVLYECGYHANLESGANLKQVEPKLPCYLLDRWGEVMENLDKRPTLFDLDKFLGECIHECLSPSKRLLKEVNEAAMDIFHRKDTGYT